MVFNTIQLLRENVGEKLNDFGIGRSFTEHKRPEQEKKKEMVNLEFMEPSVVAHTCNLSARETEAGGSTLD